MWANCLFRGWGDLVMWAWKTQLLATRRCSLDTCSWKQSQVWLTLKESDIQLKCWFFTVSYSWPGTLRSNRCLGRILYLFSLTNTWTFNCLNQLRFFCITFQFKNLPMTLNCLKGKNWAWFFLWLLWNGKNSCWILSGTSPTQAATSSMGKKLVGYLSTYTSIGLIPTVREIQGQTEYSKIFPTKMGK